MTTNQPTDRPNCWIVAITNEDRHRRWGRFHELFQNRTNARPWFQGRNETYKQQDGS
jgi:hypothetical protein